MSAINQFLLKHNLRVAQNPGVFLAETTGLSTAVRVAASRKLLAGCTTLDGMLGDISR